MKKFFAVATTAALVLTASGVSAAAQDDKTVIEGLVFIDRDGDGSYDAGENPKAGIKMKALDIDAREYRWEFTTGPDGRYKAVLPKGPKYSIGIEFTNDFTANRTEWILSESRSGADFAINGYFVSGFTFVDANGDGVKQDEEKTHGGKVKASGRSGSGAEVNIETEAGPDGAYNLDLPLGNYTLTAPDLGKNGLSLAKPVSDRDVDWLTGTYQVTTAADIRNKRLDLRYFDPKGDLAVEKPVVLPAKDTYAVGDEVDIHLKITNKGQAPERPTFILTGWSSAKTLSYSDNVKSLRSNDIEFVVKELVAPDTTLDVKLRARLVSTSLKTIHVIVVDSTWRDDPFADNVGITPIKVVEAPTTTTAPPSETIAPTTTTTSAVPKADNDNLASTGASPLGFIALGGLLLVAGAGVFLVARRRRS